MAPGDRRERERRALRGKILEAAHALFVNHGYEMLSMRKIARRIGYSATALYAHFPTKEALLQELCDSDFQALIERLRPLARVKDPVERLRRTGLVYVDFALKHPNQYRLMFMDRHPAVDKDKSRLRQGHVEEDAYAWLRHTVAECIAAGRFAKKYSDPDLVAQTAWAAMHGVVSLDIVGTHGDWVSWRAISRRARAMVDVLIAGLVEEKR